MVGTRQPAAITVFHRPDDPWSFMLLQALPQLAGIYSIALKFVTVPRPELEFTPRPQMLLANALRDCADIARHYELEFPAEPVAPAEEQVDVATRMLLAQPDPASYLQVALQLGTALFSGDHHAVHRITKSTALPTPEAARVVLAKAADRQRELGHYLSGMALFEGGWYWGIDRLHHLEQVLIALGHRRPGGVPGCLKPRTAFVPPEVGTTRTQSRDPVVVRFYCSFRSPYAYLAARRVFSLPDRYHVRIDPRLIIPMKMAGFTIPRDKAEYFRFDCAREGLRHGVRFGKFTDPFGAGLRRAMAVFPFAASQGRAQEYILSVMEGVWADGLDVAEEEGLARICRRSGLDAAEAIRHADPDADLAWADRHREELAALGQYAAPVFVLGEYMTWGQDRLPFLERVLAHAAGLRHGT